ncbi:MAG: excinuclease ABC subunit UvrA, partial [Gammaproteobacteria bacterium]|nr:excinuclease ABC subunit UvrA [Gammaproteobacteria bacterium]
MHEIRVRGARTHNLKNLSLDLPRERLIVVTGLSGSGKSSLTFDTLYAEGQRRYVESLSAYARQFLATMDKPDVDSIEGLSPAIAIEQKASSHNPRSTVGTVTEIYDYLRLLYARAGTPRCPDHGIDLSAQTVSQMVDQVLKLPEGTAVTLLAPVVSERKGEHAELLGDLAGQGFVRVRVDGRVHEMEALPELDARRKHTIEAVVDRLRVRPDVAQRLAESFETALRLSGGIARLAVAEAAAGGGHEIPRELVFSSRHACPVCGYSMPPLEPKLFSFNSPAGACPGCDGLGVEEFFDPQRVVIHPHLSLAGGAIRGWDRRNQHYFEMIQALAKHYGFDIETPWTELPPHAQQVLLHGSGAEAVEFGYRDSGGRRARRRHPFEGILPNLTRRYRETESPTVREELARYLGVRLCPQCGGTRLSPAARSVFVAGHSLPEVTRLTVGRALEFFGGLTIAGWRGEVAAKIVKGVAERLRFLSDVGLDYLTLDRSAETLSGGESQRIRLASQVGSGLTGVMYILDEPSIGLHQRDNRRLLATLKHLRDLGNTVIVVEHDEEAIREADHVVDLGPGAGASGGYLVAEGTPADIAASAASITGQYLSGRRRIALPTLRPRPNRARQITIVGARGNNLRNVTAQIPLGLFTCVTGVSGSGKSTLIVDTLFGHVAARLNGARLEAAPCERIDGLDEIDRVIDIDQSPIGRTPRSNPATYTGLFAPLRELFA